MSTALEALNELTTRARKVPLVWIPAHKGHKGNERTDELAKLGCDRPDPDTSLRVHIPPSVLKTELKRRPYREWEHEWQSQTIAHHARSFYQKPCPQKARRPDLSSGGLHGLLPVIATCTSSRPRLGSGGAIPADFVILALRR